jgi:hypothetical protein
MGLFKDCGCGCNGRKQQEKFVTALITGLVFFVIANPETFRLVRRVLGARIATPNGCPSTIGLLVHTLVFILLIWAMMNVKKDMPLVKKPMTQEPTVVMMAPTPPMRQADIVSEPGMVDEPFTDTGLELNGMDLNGTM